MTSQGLNKEPDHQLETFEVEALPHLNDLFRTALRVLGDRAEAEDVVQDTYLRAQKSFHRFEPGTNCRAWLFKILFHSIHHHRRKWWKFRSVGNAEETLNQLVYQAPMPEHLSNREVLAAFRKLPAQYRDVVLLADVWEFSYKEIGSILNIPLGTVMSRLSRGRGLLRTDLSEVAVHYGIGTAAVASA